MKLDLFLLSLHHHKDKNIKNTKFIYFFFFLISPDSLEGDLRVIEVTFCRKMNRTKENKKQVFKYSPHIKLHLKMYGGHTDNILHNGKF